MTATRTRTRKTAAKADGSLDLATGELKVGPAKKAAPVKKAPAKAPAKTTAKKAPAKKATDAPDKPKSEQTFEERDWSYLDEKDPSEQHVLFAKEINSRTEDIDISAKQVQAVLAMFPHFQRSATNKNRSQYRPLAEEIVHQRSVHMTLAHEEARRVLDGLAQEAAKKAAKKVAAPVKKAAAKKTSTAKPVAAKKAPAKRAAKKTTSTTEAF
jgi:hypothetical protein